MNIAQPLRKILNEAVAIGNAIYGSLQVYNEPLNRLQLVAYYGYDATYIRPFEFVRPGGNSASARAFALGKRILIPDVKRDPYYVTYLAVAKYLGHQAVQATPILDKHHKPIGVITTNFATVYHPTRAETEAWDRCAERAARLIQNFWIYKVLD